jgi:hypothetical protein
MVPRRRLRGKDPSDLHIGRKLRLLVLVLVLVLVLLSGNRNIALRARAVGLAQRSEQNSAQRLAGRVLDGDLRCLVRLALELRLHLARVDLSESREHADSKHN